MAEESDRTVIRVGGVTGTGPAGAASVPVPPAAPPPAPPAFSPPAPGASDGPLKPGDVLNGIFEVVRFLARGGMGEVYVGRNVVGDEQVAIKVMLPGLAADPNIRAMFLKEANTLKQLSHPVLVDYRLIAQEQRLGTFYIVTEFIDGLPLSEWMGSHTPTAIEVLALVRRVADGLRAAHALGAIHRDLTPDNILLERGELDRPRVIDFGIAKDIAPEAKTIIGDGFAGKLGFVAPEQLGVYGHDVGPWSDVYSLGLVAVAAATGKAPEMGSDSFASALAARQRGVDLTTTPPELRKLLDQMLQADPAKRLRSMDAVIVAIDAALAGKRTTKLKLSRKAAVGPTIAGAATPATPAGSSPGSRRGLMIGGGAAAVALLGVVGWVAFGTGPTPTPTPAATPSAGATQTATPSGPAGSLSGDAAVAAARAAVARALPGIDCVWLDLKSAKWNGQGVDVAFGGVAGRTGDAEAAISRAIATTGVAVSSNDFDAATIAPEQCPTVDALRAIRAAGSGHLHTADTFTMQPAGQLANGSKYAEAARIVLNFEPPPAAREYQMWGIDKTGTSLLFGKRSDVLAWPGLMRLGENSYRLQIDNNTEGWNGFIALDGTGTLPKALLTPTAGESPAAWRARFQSFAAQHDLHAEMVWFKVLPPAS